MKVIAAIAVLSIVWSHGHAQSDNPYNRNQLVLESFHRTGAGPNSTAYGIPMPPGSVQGDYYWTKSWSAGDVELKDGTLLSGVLVKYDTHNGELHFFAKPQIKFIKIKQVKSLVWTDSVGTGHMFINTSLFTELSSLDEQLLEVLHDGNAKLFKRTYTITMSPSYNAALNTGTTDTRIIQKTEWLLLNEGALTKVKNLKQLIKLFPEKSEALSRYIKDHDLDNTDAGLASCLAFLDTTGS